MKWRNNLNVKKTIMCSVCIFVCVLFISAGITIGIFCHRAIGQRDIRIRELEHQLTEQTDTIRRCREAVGDISRELGEDITGLQGIIGQLRKIREKVYVLEKFFVDNFDSNPNNNNNDTVGKVNGVE